MDKVSLGKSGSGNSVEIIMDGTCVGLISIIRDNPWRPRVEIFRLSDARTEEIEFKLEKYALLPWQDASRDMDRKIEKLLEEQFGWLLVKEEDDEDKS